MRDAQQASQRCCVGALRAARTGAAVLRYTKLHAHTHTLTQATSVNRRFAASHTLSLRNDFLVLFNTHTHTQVLEAREEVEGTDDPAALAQLLAHNRRQQEGLVGRLSAAFRAGDMGAAVSLTHQLQYVAKLEQEIVKKLPQL